MYDFVVIDFANHVSRCSYVQSEPMQRSDGMEVGHVHRTCRSLMAMRRNFHGRFVFALEGYPKKRYELLSTYKTRPPKVFDPRIDCLRMVRHMDALFIRDEHLEADDAIATFCLRNWRSKILVVSKDRDLWYLLQYFPRVTVLYADQTPDVAACRSQLKCLPLQIPLLKAIAGDISDTVPRLKVRGLEGITTTHPEWMGHGCPTDPESYMAWAKRNLEPKIVEKIEAVKGTLQTMFEVCSLDESCNYTTEEGAADLDGLHAFLDEFECPTLMGSAHTLTGY